MKKIFEGKSCMAEYIPDKKTVFFTFEGYPILEESKDVYLKVFEFMKSNPVVAFLQDLTKMKGTFSNLNDFFIETLRPAVDLGFKYSALILNDDVFTAFAASDLVKKVTMIEIQIFKNKPDADEWLNSRIEKKL